MPLVPYRKLLAPCLSLAGMATFAYLVGAAAMFFQLPTSDFLGKALVGVSDWYDHTPPSEASDDLPQEGLPQTGETSVDHPEETFDGFTLYAHGPNTRDLATQAVLMNMRRQVVHRWAIPFSRIFPQQTHLRTRQPDLLVCFFECRLFPNGDLLAVLHGRTVPTGCGLVKLDKRARRSATLESLFRAWPAVECRR